MFDLVADVEAYPKFVPLCSALRVRRRDERPDGTVVLVADMTVSFKLVRETFTSRVVLDREHRQIEVRYLDGPFQRLENRWRFEEAPGGGARVEFFIDYDFKSRTLGALMGAMFDRAFRKFAEAFEARATVVYGRLGA
jgi:coenzyme Q-binding protein COQ10